ncbi:MAG: phage holin family protein [Candidatus Saganbacteria bacterium]|nr:phage holin family protein [Candidatus Saganbacteria bacterium]
MFNFLLMWFVNVVALITVVYILPGLQFDSWTAAIVAGLILGLINTFFKPIILILTLPINIFTLGLFTLIINAGLFFLTALIVKGFVVAGFWPAFWGALLFSIISALINWLIKTKP